MSVRTSMIAAGLLSAVVLQAEAYTPLFNYDQNTHFTVEGDFDGDGDLDLFVQPKLKSSDTGLMPKNINETLDPAIHKYWVGQHPQITAIEDWSDEYYKAFAANLTSSPGDELLLLGRQDIVLLHGEIVTPIVILKDPRNAIVSWDASKNASFTSFDFDANPDSYQLHFGDFDGDGFDEIILQGLTAGSTSYVLDSDGSLNQTLANGYQGIDWSAAAYEFVIDDLNGDGRDDIQLVSNSASLPDNSAFFGSGGTIVSVAIEYDPNNASRPDFAHKSSGVPDAQASLIYVPDSDIVGAVEGQAGVSGGAATYTIPIALPPGRAGMQPSVGLSYSSRSGNNIAGVGWSLSAGSSIHRCAQTAANDGANLSVRGLDLFDKLCLNGQRLVVVNGTQYGKSGAEYRTEMDSFAKIVQLGNLGSGTVSFTVYNKNGQVDYYGLGGTSRHNRSGSDTYAWAISRSEDRSLMKNSIIYTYSKPSTGEFLLSRINYTGESTVLGNRVVEFEYETALPNDQSISYQAGEYSKRTKRLAKIKTFVNDTQKVREYRLGYGESAASKRSLLNTVTECAVKDAIETCLPSTHFSHFNQTVGLSTTNDIESLLPSNIVENLADDDGFRFKDLDGDGVSELIVTRIDRSAYPYSVQSVEIYKASGTSGEYQLVNGNADHRIYQSVDGDLNSNGITDFLFYNKDINRMQYMELDENFQAQVYNFGHTNVAGYIPGSVGDTYVTDINSDGYADIIRMTQGRVAWYFLNDKVDAATPSFSGPYDLIDLRDRRAEYQFYFESSSLMDLDGDGLPDLVLSYNSADGVTELNVAFNELQGDGTIDVVRLTAAQMNLPANQHQNQYLFADINGDGLKDYVRATGTSSSNFAWTVQLNKGDRTFANAQPLGSNIGLHRWTVGTGDNGAYKTQAKFGGVKAVDLDSDGKEELLVVTGSDDDVCLTFSGHRFNWTTNTYEGEPVDVQSCNDQIQAAMHANTGQGATQIALNLGHYDLRRFNWTLLDFKYENDQFNLERSQADFVKAPLADVGFLEGSVYESLRFEDVDNDGYLDAVSRVLDSYASTNNVNVGGNFTGVALSVSHNNANVTSELVVNRNQSVIQGRHNDTLYRVEDGLGRVAEWDIYPMSTQSLVADLPFYEVPSLVEKENRYTNGLSRNYLYFTSSMPLVHEFRQSNGQQGLIANQYYYREAIYNREGRGFQGFRSVIVDSPTGIDELGTLTYTRSVSDFHQVFPIAGKIEEVRTCLATNELQPCSSGLLSRTQIDQYLELNTINLNTYWVVPHKVTKQSFDLLNSNYELSKSITTIEEVDVDARFGNIISTNEWVDTKFGEIEKTIVNSYLAADEADWWVNKLENTTVTTEALTNTSANTVYDATLDSKTILRTRFTYDPQSRRQDEVTTEVVLGEGKSVVVDTDYNAYGLPIQVTTSSIGETDRIVYSRYSDDFYFVDEVESKSDDSSNVLHISYSETAPEHGQFISTIDLNGNVSTIEYDAFGRMIETTAQGVPSAYKRYFLCGSGKGTTCANDAVYQVATFQAGSPTIYSHHDALNRDILAETVGFDGDSSIFAFTTFNVLGQKLFESVPTKTSTPIPSVESLNPDNFMGTRFEGYDALGRLIQRKTDTAGSSLQVTYYHEGHTTTITTNNKPPMTRTYDGAGRLIETMQEDYDQSQSYTRYAYDGMGNPIVMQDANGHSITAEYNALGQKKRVDDPNMGSKTFTYTGFGEVHSETDAKGITTTFEYDRLGRLTHRYVGELTNPQASFVYDIAPKGNTGEQCIGLLFKEEQLENNHSKTVGYDELCRATSSSQIIDGQTYITTTHLDSYFGRAKGITYPNGLTVEYRYNDLGYLTKVKNAANDYVYQEITSMDAWGQWSSAKMAGDNLKVERSYYASGQMLASKLSSGDGNSDYQAFDYDYNNYGDLTKFQVSNFLGTSTSISVEEYDNDTLHRLKSSALIVDGTPRQTIDYDYDKVGNLKTKSDFSTVNGMSYGNGSRSTGNAGPNAVLSVTLANSAGTRTYEYDLNGNLENDKLNGAQLRHIDYNAFNKPTLITVSGGHKLSPLDQNNTGASTTAFFYGADQMRFKQVKTTSGEVETTLYVGKVYEEVITSNRTEKKVFIDDVAMQTEIIENGTTEFKIGFFHKDRLGSAVAISDETGSNIQFRSFDPFGKPREGNLTRSPNAIIGSDLYKRGFTDHEHLDDSQLIHMNGRAYDYNLGRFLSVDPFIQAPGNSQSMNPYSYIMNNPLAGTDPSGYSANCAGVFDINCIDKSEGFYAGMEATYSTEKSNGSACRHGNCGGQAAMTTTVQFYGVESFEVTGTEEEARALFKDAKVLYLKSGGTEEVKTFSRADLGFRRADLGFGSLPMGCDTRGGCQSAMNADLFAKGKISQEEYNRMNTAQAQGVVIGAMIVLPGPEDVALAAFITSKAAQWITRVSGEVLAGMRTAKVTNRVTGARTLKDWDFDGAEAAYDVIRKQDDVAAIAANTGMKQFHIAKIKNHLFNNSHMLDDGMRRFDADPMIANAWNRMQAGTHTAADMKILKHELFESKFEGIFKTNYRTSHNAANRAGYHSGLE